MNKRILIFILAILLGCGNIQNIRTIDSAAGKAESGQLKFMTVNIRAAGGRQNPYANPDIVEETRESLTRIAGAIDSVDPDFVGLQEVRGIYQARFLAEKLNLNYVYSVHARESWWGLAVLSKYKIIDVRTKIINLGNRHGDRIALMCTMDIGQKKLRMVNVDFIPENYKGQVEETMPLLNPLEGPVVLVGNFSRRAEYAELPDIRTQVKAACEVVKTYEGRCIDPVDMKNPYIFIDPNIFTVLNAGLVSIQKPDGQDLSAEWATLKFKD